MYSKETLWTEFKSFSSRKVNCSFRLPNKMLVKAREEGLNVKKY
jgi:hypothetical protein